MKTIKLLILASVIGFFSQSCYKRGGPWGTKGKGENVKETRDLKDFNQINLSVDADISYTQDSIYLVEISAQANILKIMTTEVKGTELTIDFKRNVWDHNKIKIIIHTPDIKAFTISGSGDIQVQKSLVSSALELNISGSGNLAIPSLTVTSLITRINGSGNVQISDGTIGSEDFTVSGSGDIDAVQAVCTTNVSRVSGSGDITINVTESLNVRISGSGNIKYKGRPAIDSEISGSGKLIHIN